MKFFHLADLHLGKSVYEHSLLPDQKHVLDQITVAVQVEKPAALIIAGDVFDRAVPPPEAVRLFGDFLVELKVIDPELVIAIIPGNHDSAARLSFASGILGLSGVHIRADAKDASLPITIQSGGELARLWLLPFLSPGALTPEMLQATLEMAGSQPQLQSISQKSGISVQDIQVSKAEVSKKRPFQAVSTENSPETGLEFAEPAIGATGARAKPSEPSLLRSQAELFSAAISMIQAARLRLSPSPGIADILVCHAFATGGAAGESERVFLGSAELVDPALFEAFDYVALGHLHRCQSAGAKGMYAGSPIAYAFSEGQVDRGFLVVEVGPGSYSSELCLVKPLRRMVRVTGSYEQVRHDPRWEAYKGDYIEAILDDADSILNPLGPLRERFPFLLSLKQAVFDRRQGTDQEAEADSGEEPDGTLAEDDFIAFHQELRGCPPDPALMDLFTELYQEANNEAS